MKRFLVVIVVSILCFSISVAYATDYSSMTDAELKDQFNAIRNELTARGLVAENKTVILDQSDIQIYINGDIRIEKQYSWDTAFSLFIPIVIINNTSSTIDMLVEDASVNGWSTDGHVYVNVPAGKKAKTEIVFSLEDTEVETLSDFSDVEFALNIYDEHTWNDIIKLSNPITIFAK